MEIVIWTIVGVVLGAAIGSVATWWWNRARGGGDTIGQLKRENQKFREEVTEHFVETARLINQLTDSYKEVFDHLSKGANELADEKALAEKMPQVGDEEVRLRRIGAPAESSSAQSESGASKDSRPESSKTPKDGETTPKADEGKNRPPHERSDIEAGPRREERKASDRDVDPLKRRSDRPDGSSTASSSGSGGARESGASAGTDDRGSSERSAESKRSGQSADAGNGDKRKDSGQPEKSGNSGESGDSDESGSSDRSGGSGGQTSGSSKSEKKSDGS